jgi:ribonuclease P protein component
MSVMLSSNNKIKSAKTIDLLFSKGKYLKVPGFNLVYLKQQNKNPCGLCVGFSVGKKSQALAVDRNKTKRLMRESFRLCCGAVLNSKKTYYNLMFLCLESNPPSFSVVSDKIKSLLLSFTETIKND